MIRGREETGPPRARYSGLTSGATKLAIETDSRSKKNPRLRSLACFRQSRREAASRGGPIWVDGARRGRRDEGGKTRARDTGRPVFGGVLGGSKADDGLEERWGGCLCYTPPLLGESLVGKRKKSVWWVSPCRPRASAPQSQIPIQLAVGCPRRSGRPCGCGPTPIRRQPPLDPGLGSSRLPPSPTLFRSSSSSSNSTSLCPACLTHH